MSSRGSAIWRLVATLLFTLNFCMMLVGMNPINVDDGYGIEIASGVLMVLSIVASWWYNNAVTRKAIIAKGLLLKLKNKPMSYDEFEKYVEAKKEMDAQ